MFDAEGGPAGAAAEVLPFAPGMILVDTLDSGSVARYRRGAGRLIVALSFGAAAYALAGLLIGAQLRDDLFMLLGAGMAAAVAVAFLFAARASRSASPEKGSAIIPDSSVGRRRPRGTLVSRRVSPDDRALDSRPS